ncbi:MAG: PAS domain-containing protein [Proteobacteria bacterium]|nr:PAS domain-containing protein [Pseudomonadota bacterium]
MRSAALEWSLLCAVLVLLAALLSVWRWREFDAAGDFERRRLQLQAQRMGEQLKLTLRAIDKALVGVRADVAAGDPARLPARLDALDAAAAAIDALQVVDADGRVLAADSGSLDVSLSHATQPCFTRMAAQPDPDVLYLCAPIRDASGRWTSDVLRTLDDGGVGRFRGAVVATLDAGFLDAMLQSGLYAPDMKVLLLHGSGVVAVSSWPEVIPIGTDYGRKPDSLFMRYRASGRASGVVEGSSKVGREDVMVAFYTVLTDDPRLDGPLVLSMSRSTDAAYRPWMIGNAWTLAGWLAAVLATAVSLHLAQRRRRVQTHAAAMQARQRIEQLEFVELVVQGADLSLWAWDLPSRRLEVDARWCAMVGCPADDLDDAARDWRNRAHPDDRAEMAALLRKHLRGETPYADHEIRLRHDDGRWIWVHVRGKVVERDAEGRPVRLVGTQQDITERKTAEHELRERATQLRHVADAMPGTVARFDMARRFIFANANFERWLGIAPDRLIGRTTTEVFGSRTHGEWEPYVLRVEAGERVAFETSFESPTRGRRHLLATLVPDIGTDGAVCGHFSVTVDITEQRAAEAERRALEDHLRDTQRLESLGTLAGGIAHDFNNVLGAIIGNAELARTEVEPEHLVQRSLVQISQSAQRARGLVQQILTFSRHEQHEHAVQPLRPLVEETVAMLRATLPARVALATEFDDAPLYANADATQIHQVLMNLGTNAWHALAEQAGHIEIGLAPVELPAGGAGAVAGLSAGHYAHLWISDDGNGMDAATAARIFDPFFTTKPVGQGTGLGLSVVHGIVKAHLGAITVETAPGAGTCIDVYLPAATKPSQLGEPAAAAERRVPRGHGRHVMYVDDDETMGLLAERLLEQAGYRVTRCGSARQALAAFIAAPRDLDVLVTDYNMPELSGLALAAEFARIRPELPIVISSGYLGDELSAGAERAGIRHLVRKQNTYEELADVVRRAIDEAERLAERVA